MEENVSKYGLLHIGKNIQSYQWVVLILRVLYALYFLIVY